nr:replication/maintenance protein RepL [Staphylococcus epidermidis]
MLDMIGGKKVKMVKYMVDNVELSKNRMIGRRREIGKGRGRSVERVIRRVKMLEEGNIIKRKSGVLMLKGEVVMRGEEEKEK